MNALKGIAFALTSVLASAPVWADETVLHTFIPYPQGAYPQANVCLGPGNLIYGTALGGPYLAATRFYLPNSAGVVYRVNNAGNGAVAHTFTGGADGGFPAAGVICDSAGNVYGTTAFGGSDGAGLVYRMDGLGHQSVLYTFTGGADGGFPFGGLIRDSGGNLYGTTQGGGVYGAGVVFKLDSTGHETVLYSFTGGNDGGDFPFGSPNLYGALIRDSAGNLYGTTQFGGVYGAGVVFKLSPSGQESILWNFTGGNDGGGPVGSLLLDSTANLYGVTNYGGQYGAGVVYKLSGVNQQSVLYNFTGGNDGGSPYSGVILDSAGNLYGTTTYAGASNFGVIYKIDSTGHETVLYTFTGKADGGYPVGLVSDSAGNLYGATNGGGQAGAGAVFKLDTTLHEFVLYSFPGLDGSNPAGPVIQDSAGNLYGATCCGGPAHSDVLGVTGAGMIYKLDATGHETILHNFTGGADGANPSSGLIMDGAGNLYGTTDGGGSAGAGVVFKLDPKGHETVLYSFTGQLDGLDPVGGVIMDSAGNLYGTTQYGGSSGFGTVYKLDPTGHETILHNFAGPLFGGPGADGAYPGGISQLPDFLTFSAAAGLTRDSAGNLYGTTRLGGDGYGGYPGGVAYKLDPSGNETILYDFCQQQYCADGTFAFGGLILDAAGNLYGNAWSGGPPSAGFPGVVYKLDRTGHETVVYPFTGFSDGNGPIGNLILDSADNLYGVTQFGGQGPCRYFGCGVVFKVDPAGHESVLYSFTGGSDGSEPTAGMIRDSAGNFYGTTSFGGTADAGVVYKLTPGATAQASSAASSIQPPPNASRPTSPACSLPHAPPHMGCPSKVPPKRPMP